MKKTFAFAWLFQMPLLATISMLSQASSVAAEPALSLEVPPQESRHRVNLGFQIGFNMPVTFKNLGGYAALSAPKLTLDQDGYNYDNGYVLVDSSGNAMGYSRYWGYDPGTPTPGDNSIVLTRSSAEASAKATDDSEASPGFQLDYQREFIHKESWQGGLGIGFAYARLDISDSSPQYGNSSLTRDVYGFPEGVNVVPGSPLTGYQGRKEIAGSVILADPLLPSTTTVLNGQAITGNRQFQANLYRFRLGPWVDFPVSKSIALSFSAGFALAYVESGYQFDESVRVGNLPPISRSGKGDNSAWMAGGYAAGNLSIALGKQWSAFGGIEFQTLGQYSHTVNGKEAVLDLRQSLYGIIGVSHAF